MGKLNRSADKGVAEKICRTMVKAKNDSKDAGSEGGNYALKWQGIV